RRKVYVVHLRVVVGVHGGRRNLPFSAINRLTNLAQLPMELKCDGTLHVAQGILTPNGNRTVVSPAVRISDLVADQVKLVERLLLRGLRHPGELMNISLH